MPTAYIQAIEVAKKANAEAQRLGDIAYYARNAYLVARANRGIGPNEFAKFQDARRTYDVAKAAASKARAAAKSADFAVDSARRVVFR